MSCLPPLAYVPMMIPYPGTPGAPVFDGQNITHFLDLYSQLCSDYRLSESEKIYRLPWYCEFFTGNYIKILIKGADWATARLILRREYKNNDLDQLMNSREFLEALKKKSRSEDDDLMQYCHMFASISRDLVLRRRLDLYTQCQWFLQGLPERVMIEIFYRYDIDLEDDDGLDFEDLLEKALVLIKGRKYLADLIRNKETDLVNKNAGLQEKVPTTPNIVEAFTYPAQDLTPPTQFHTVKGAIQEDVPVVRIHTSRVEEVQAGEVSSGANDILISDAAEDFYEDLDALSTDFEPRDKKVVQPHVDSATAVESFDDNMGFGRYTYRPGTSSKRTPWEFLNSLEAGIGARKKAGKIPEEGFAGFDGIIGGREVIKSEDHG